MVAKSRLHATAISEVADGSYWHSLPPHAPGECRGADGAPCPEPPDEPCAHAHRTSAAAVRCSRNRKPFA